MSCKRVEEGLDAFLDGFEEAMAYSLGCLRLSPQCVTGRVVICLRPCVHFEVGSMTDVYGVEYWRFWTERLPQYAPVSERCRKVLECMFKRASQRVCEGTKGFQ